MSAVRFRKMTIVVSAAVLCCVPFVRSAIANPSPAQNFVSPTAHLFAVPASMQPQVDFWVLIFAKYGKDQSVFHFRQDPGIVYSVVDSSKLATAFSGSKFERMKNAALEEEARRIQTTLLALAGGKQADSPFERRIERMFAKYGPEYRRKYKEAADPEQIRSQTGIRERFREALVRAPRYLHAIEQIFAQRGLPKEVGRLPYVESSFDYNAYSSVGAAGIWQFMRSTGKKYMRIDNYVDERRDPIIASRAAAEYLSHAYRVLGAWPLAMTSYNHGINGVLRAAKTVGSTDIAKIIREYQGESFGFASKNFYASFLAALQAERDYQVYFPGLQKESPLLFDEVRLSRPTRFQELMRLSGDSETLTRELNPALLKPVTSGRIPVPAGFLFKVSKGKGSRILQGVPGSSVYSVVDAPLVHLRTGPDILPKKSVKKKVTKKAQPVKKTPAKAVLQKKKVVSKRK